MRLATKASIILGILGVATALAAAQNATPEPRPQNAPRYDAQGRILFPANYRDWVYLSSGVGMTYKGGGDEDNPMFTNVFVTPEAYRVFTATGKWPDKTMFVVEERGSSSKGSINKGGRYQAAFMGLGVEVKDEARFPEKWAYFAFSGRQDAAGALPKQQCWQCHEDHAAVEHSFVQFYPTLQPTARKFGVYKPGAADSVP